MNSDTSFVRFMEVDKGYSLSQVFSLGQDSEDDLIFKFKGLDRIIIATKCNSVRSISYTTKDSLRYYQLEKSIIEDGANFRVIDDRPSINSIQKTCSDFYGFQIMIILAPGVEYYIQLTR
jgi:hypothetical protein